MAQQGTLLPGGRVWLATEEDNRQQLDWTAAEIVKVVNQDRVVVRYMEPPTAPHRPPTAKDEEVDVRKLQHRNPENMEEAEDLTTLSELNAPSILHTLASRYGKNRIYTYSGTVLISVNPYQRYPELYTRKVLESYFNQPLEAAYRSMLFDSRSQSILVSGESGAGKTETTKVLLQFFALVGRSESQLEEKVLQSTPILEAFGNAKTIWNDNSSRFGKFIKIEFDRTGNITGASILTYLLEKSRIVRPQRNERNYHIFYRLLSGASGEQRKLLRLTAPQDYYYLRQSECAVIEEVDDAAEFEHTVKALDIVGITRSEQDQIYTVLSAILHLGNVAFLGDDKARLKDSEALTIVRNLLYSASLLGCEPRDLERALLTREVKTGNESIVVPMSHAQAVNSRDTLAMLLYSRMFDWLVAKINANIVRTAPPHSFISILDIYGFECFDVNSFEQFCINYANEKLQQQFNNHIFKLEQEEYVREKFKDNQECIDLIEGSMGILTVLDEESRFPKATDDTFLTKLVGSHRKHINFKLPDVGEAAFAVVHYAGRVKYYTRGFLEKNKDYLVSEHLNLLGKGSPFVATLVGASSSSAVNKLSLSGSAGSRQSIDPLQPSPRGGRASVDMSSRASLDRRTSDADLKSPRNKPAAASSFAFVSVASQFRDSLANLMDTIGQTEPHYIRCVKPNDAKRPRDYVRKRVLHQLRSGGVLEAVRIAAAGFPTRIPLDEFFYRYKLLMPGAKPERAKEACQVYFKTLSLGPEKLQFGLTKLFLRAGIIAMLESLRIARLNQCATRVQKHWRRFVARRKFVRERKAIVKMQTALRVVRAKGEVVQRRTNRAAVRLQKNVRRVIQRLRFIRLRKTALLVQGTVRTLVAKRHFLAERKRRAAEMVQSYWRMHVEQMRFLALYRAVVLAQARVRARHARKVLRQLRIDAKSVGEMSKQKEEAVRRANEETAKRKAAEDENAKLRAELQGAGAARAKELQEEVESAKRRATEIESEAASLRLWQEQMKETKAEEERVRKAEEEARILKSEEDKKQKEVEEAKRKEEENKRKAEELAKVEEEKQRRRQAKLLQREAEEAAQESARKAAEEQRALAEKAKSGEERVRVNELEEQVSMLRAELSAATTALSAATTVEEKLKKAAEESSAADAEMQAKHATARQVLEAERKELQEAQKNFAAEKVATPQGRVVSSEEEAKQKAELEAAWAVLVNGHERRIIDLSAENDALRAENLALRAENAHLKQVGAGAGSMLTSTASRASLPAFSSPHPTLPLPHGASSALASIATPAPVAAESAASSVASREIQLPDQSAEPIAQPPLAEQKTLAAGADAIVGSSALSSSLDARQLAATLRVKEALISQLMERQMKAEDEVQDWRERAEAAERRLIAAKSPRSPSPRPMKDDARADQRLVSAQEEMARQAELVTSLRTELRARDAKLTELQVKEAQVGDLERRLAAQATTLAQLQSVPVPPAPPTPPLQAVETETVKQLKAEMYDLAKQLEREKEKLAKLPAQPSTDAQELMQQLEATEKRLKAAVAARKESADLLRLKEAQVATLSASQRDAQKEALAKNETIALLKAGLKNQAEGYNLPVDLERLTRAHQAHQTQCVFLQNEIATLEDHVKTLGQLHKQTTADLEAQINEAVAEARRLRKLLYEKGGIAAMESEFESACHELFFALATGIKLSLLLSGLHVTEDVSALFVNVKQQGLHFSRWNNYLRRHLTPEKP